MCGDKLWRMAVVDKFATVTEMAKLIYPKTVSCDQSVFGLDRILSKMTYLVTTDHIWTIICF